MIYVFENPDSYLFNSIAFAKSNFVYSLWTWWIIFFFYRKYFLWSLSFLVGALKCSFHYSFMYCNDQTLVVDTMRFTKGIMLLLQSFKKFLFKCFVSYYRTFLQPRMFTMNFRIFFLRIYRKSTNVGNTVFDSGSVLSWKWMHLIINVLDYVCDLQCIPLIMSFINYFVYKNELFY